MAGLRFALIILLGVGTVLQTVMGQAMMMVPAPMIIRHPTHPHHMGQLIQPVHITEEYSGTKEPIDEARLNQRIKELELSQQSLRQKQMELDDKMAVLHDEAMRCEKQIADSQRELHRMEELERIQYMEQVRLEQLIERHRMAEYQEKLNQERRERQRAIEEMNYEEERQRNASKKEQYDETPSNSNYQTRIEEETSGRYKDESNEPGKDALRTEDLPERSRKNERPHSTDLLRPIPGQATIFPDLQPQMAPSGKHVIEKKGLQNEPTLRLNKSGHGFKLVSEPKDELSSGVSPLNKTESTLVRRTLERSTGTASEPL